MIDDAAPATPQHSLAVSVIDHQQNIVLASDLVQLRQRSDIAIHAEDTIGDNQPLSVFAGLGDPAAQIIDIVMLISHDLRPAQPAAIDDAGVVQLVGENHIATTDQRGDSRQISGESALKCDDGLGVFESGQPLLQLIACSVIVPAMVRTAPGPMP
jgi:hypothetical protein